MSIRGSTALVSPHGNVSRRAGFTLVEIELKTGRTHQIRVHMARIRHPIVGDSLYGEDKRARGIHNLDRRQADQMVRDTRRQLLHAAELRLVHPATGEEMTFKAPLPADMEHVLRGLRAED